MTRSRNASPDISKGLPKDHSRSMNVFDFLVPIAVGAVFVVLLLGLFNMMRGGSANRSQTLMRWRVILQFVAVVVIMAAIWFAAR